MESEKKMESEIKFNIDEKAATIYVMKVFHTTVDEVWNHFSKKELIDQWWAPKPYQCETVKLNFEPNGFWNYAMISPTHEKQFSAVRFNEIKFHRSFDYTAFFTDEEGNIKSEFSSSNWLIGFTGVQPGMKLTVNIHFKSSSDLEQLLKINFEEGFKKGLQQLEELLNKKDQL